MVASPSPTAVTMPSETAATFLFDEYHETEVSVALSGVTLAVSVMLFPFLRVTLARFKAIPVTFITSPGSSPPPEGDAAVALTL